jgi:hypothetical protein
MVRWQLKINFREWLSIGSLPRKHKKGGGDASAFSSSVPSIPWRLRQGDVHPAILRLANAVIRIHEW